MKNKKTLRTAIFAATFVLIIVLSAVAADSLYNPNADKFTSELGKNLSALCSNSDLSQTQLLMIERADIKNVKYDTDDNGTTKFYAELRLINPKINCGSYSGENPQEYLQNAVDSLFNNKRSYVSCEIIGLCIDDKPVIDNETLQRIIDCTKESWNGGQNLIENKDLISAVTDLFCPAPYENRNYSDSTIYSAAYNKFLKESSEYFAEKGMTISGETSNDASAIRSIMQEIITPYLCSVKDIKLSQASDKNGVLRLSFNSLDVTGSISAEKSKIFSDVSDTDVSTATQSIFNAITSDISSYSADKAFKCSIDIDLADLISDVFSNSSGYFSTLHAMTEYYSFSASDAVNGRKNLKTLEKSGIISGKSNATWPVEFKRNAGDGNAIISIIKIDDSGNESSIMKIFIADGGSYMVCLPRGQYRINIAVGTNYFGAEQLFGDDGIYFKDEDVFDVASSPTVTVEKHEEENFSIIEYLLNKNNGGTCISKADF